MEQLYMQLKEIDALLEQIDAITVNQTTVLLQEDSLDEDETINMIETMVDYKEELINQLQKVEELFNQNYLKEKSKLKKKSDILRFKECVAKILERKQRIQQAERNNIRIMQAKGNYKTKRTEIPRNPGEVAAAYKKQQEKA